MLPIPTRGQQAAITAISPMFVGDSVGMILTIYGKGMVNIDMTQRMRIGDTACPWTNWISESSITGMAPTVCIQTFEEFALFYTK